MNFNLVEMYNGLLRFNKHILNELAEGLKHLPNLDGVSKGDSLIEYANFDNQAALNTNLTSDGFKQGGLGAGVTNLAWDRWTAFNGNNPIVQTYWTAEHNIGNSINDRVTALENASQS